MGANAQTTVPTFTASQVLTADQMNESARTGVPVFATTGTRDAAFGGTGEKTLAEGQLCYVEGTGFQTYNGTAWVTWGTAPSAGALVLITQQTIGAAVSSVTVTGCFSGTYENYRIILSGGVASTNVNLRMTLGATTTGYYGFAVYGVHNSNTVNGTAENNAAYWDYAFLGSANALTGVVDLLQPQTAKRTQVIAFPQVAATSAAGISVFKSGFLDDTTQYTAFTLTCNTGNITGGTIRVYGYSNS